MFKSLKAQLLFYFFVANIIILFSFSFFLYTTAQKGILDKLDTQLETFSIDAIEHLVGDDRYSAQKIAQFLKKEFRRKELYSKIIYYDVKKDEIAHQSLSSNNMRDIFLVPLNNKSNLHDIFYFNRGAYRVTSMLIAEEKEIKIFFQLASKKVISTPYLENLKFSLLISVPIILFLLIFIVNLLINKTLYPVKKVIDSVNIISSDKLSSRVNSTNIPIEIKELVDTFNNLLENIEESFSRISTFSSDASHELKTPLTVIRGEIEVALRKKREINEYEYVLQNILDEVISIQDTIDQLFLLSKKDTVELNYNSQEIYVDELLSDVVSQLQKVAEEKSIKIYIDSIVPLSIYANDTLIKIVISNLIRNSIIYSDTNSKIHISLSKSNDLYVLKIQDDGCGIPYEDLPFIFDRFYRVDQARTRQKTGTGLGLSIVKMILDIYNYDIEVASKFGVGTTMLVKLRMNKI